MLEASDGCLMTAAVPSEISEPYFTKRIYLGSQDSADNYREVSEGEAARMATEWHMSHTDNSDAMTPDGAKAPTGRM